MGGAQIIPIPASITPPQSSILLHLLSISEYLLVRETGMGSKESMKVTHRVHYACWIVMLHAVNHHVISALSHRTSAFRQVRGKSSAAAFSSLSSTRAYYTSTRRNNVRLLVKVSTHDDFYEEQVSFSNSNFNNDILSDESIQSAREQIQPHFSFALDP